jgi:hypothetical protein
VISRNSTGEKKPLDLDKRLAELKQELERLDQAIEILERENPKPNLRQNQIIMGLTVVRKLIS